MAVKEIRFDKQDVVTCDERGRATLGSEFADEQVFVYVAELPNPDELVEPPEEEQEILGKMHSWAKQNDIEVIDYHPYEGTVEDKDGERHETPYVVPE